MLFDSTDLYTAPENSAVVDCIHDILYSKSIVVVSCYEVNAEEHSASFLYVLCLFSLTYSKVVCMQVGCV